MTSRERKTPSFAWEQQIGATTPHDLQQDRIRVEALRLTDGRNLLLGVVADGEGHPAAGEAAEYLINQVFTTIRRGRNEDLTACLSKALQSAHLRIQEMEAQVAVSAVALHRDRLHLAHAGHTMAILVREGRPLPLTQASLGLLGSEALEIRSGGSEGIQLRPGDQLILATDGLTRKSPEDGQPFVSLEEVARQVEGNTPMEAARHLISLALGRDVDDNITVGVLQARRRRRKPGNLWKPAALVGGLALVAAGILLLRPEGQAPPPAPVTDYGYAVLIDGSVAMEVEGGGSDPASRLEAIPPLSTITVQQPSRLTLQTNARASTAGSMASLYLSPESRVTLSLIDAGLDLPEAQRDLAGHSVFELSTGALLIMRAEGRRSFEVLVPSGSAALVGSNAGALGVEIASLAVTLDCLLGECEVRAGETSRTLLQAGSRVSIREGELSAEVIISAESLERWNQLCNACLANTSYLPLLVKRLRP